MVTTIYWSNPTATLHARRRPRRARRDARRHRRTASSPARPTGPSGTTASPASTATRPIPVGYVATMRAVFREARRVLADDGTCWLNLGDSYSASGGAATGMHAYLGPGLTRPHAPGWAPRTCSACPGGWRSRCKTTAGSCGTRSCGTSRTPCPSRCVTGSPAGTSWSSCSSSPGLLVRPRPDPRTARDRGQAARGTAATARAATGAQVRPGHPRRGRHRGRPPKYGPHTRQVIAARRYGTAAARRGAPQRAQPRRRLVDPHPPLPRAALRRLPDRPAAPVHRGGVQAGRHGARPVLRHRHDRPRRARRSAGRFTGIELNPAFAALAAERLRHAAEPEPDGTEGRRQ